MRSFSLLLVLVALPFSAAFDVPASHRLDPSIPTVSPHHQPNVTSDSCMGQCGFIMVESIAKHIGYEMTMELLKLNYNDFIRTFANVTFFENFCGIYHRFQHCASQCDSGYLHEILMRSSEVIDQYCIYNFAEIKRLFPCIIEAPPAQDCMRVCTPHHKAVTTIVSHFGSIASDSDSSKAEKYLGESCEYVICSLNCDVPDIANRCGHETANLVVELTRKSFDSMERTSLDTGIVKKWPKLCDDIKTFRLPQPVNPPVVENAVISQSPRQPAALVQSSSSVASATLNSSSATSPILLLLIPIIALVW